MSNFPEIKEVLLHAIKEAGALVAKGFEADFKVDFKGDINNLVTEVDQASERLILSIVQAHFPDHGIIGEEYGNQQENARYKWVIDPIDGTVNFAHRIPLCCISIAVMENDELILGAVYSPMMNELFFAEKGQGAYLNNRRIQVSENGQLEKAFLVTGFPYVFPDDFNPVDIFEHFLRLGLPIRRLGSAALDLCWVAAGRFDAFWENNLQPYDIAAGILIVEEAGGITTNYNNEKITIQGKQVLASNQKMHTTLLDEIQQALNK